MANQLLKKNFSVNNIVKYDNLHSFIVGELRDQAVATIIALDDTLAESTESFTDDFILHKIFKNYRVSQGKPHGLRLSFIGNSVLKQEFEYHQYDHNDTVNNEIYISLDRNMVWPYYVAKNFVIFYSDVDAAWFKLNGESLRDYKEYI